MAAGFDAAAHVNAVGADGSHAIRNVLGRKAAAYQHLAIVGDSRDGAPIECHAGSAARTCHRRVEQQNCARMQVCRGLDRRRLAGAWRNVNRFDDLAVNGRDETGFLLAVQLHDKVGEK